ncbi:hypothetical protein M231_03939 [Tremella mesenterica]|uniref:Uncharacterized protein n=1 Tax=Tremella mesenterica TaxID=5217 RepID=A0A4Q1BLT3_TREME|nr:hypothetical protein M231_03939 [Tremella mesenterica]
MTTDAGREDHIRKGSPHGSPLGDVETELSASEINRILRQLEGEWDGDSSSDSDYDSSCGDVEEIGAGVPISLADINDELSGFGGGSSKRTPLTYTSSVSDEDTQAPYNLGAGWMAEDESMINTPFGKLCQDVSRNVLRDPDPIFSALELEPEQKDYFQSFLDSRASETVKLSKRCLEIGQAAKTLQDQLLLMLGAEKLVNSDDVLTELENAVMNQNWEVAASILVALRSIKCIDFRKGDKVRTALEALQTLGQGAEAFHPDRTEHDWDRQSSKARKESRTATRTGGLSYSRKNSSPVEYREPASRLTVHPRTSSDPSDSTSSISSEEFSKFAHKNSPYSHTDEQVQSDGDEDPDLIPLIRQTAQECLKRATDFSRFQRKSSRHKGPMTFQNPLYSIREEGTFLLCASPDDKYAQHMSDKLAFTAALQTVLNRFEYLDHGSDRSPSFDSSEGMPLVDDFIAACKAQDWGGAGGVLLISEETANDMGRRRTQTTKLTGAMNGLSKTIQRLRRWGKF